MGQSTRIRCRIMENIYSFLIDLSRTLLCNSDFLCQLECIKLVFFKFISNISRSLFFCVGLVKCQTPNQTLSWIQTIKKFRTETREERYETMTREKFRRKICVKYLREVPSKVSSSVYFSKSLLVQRMGSKCLMCPRFWMRCAWLKKKQTKMCLLWNLIKYRVVNDDVLQPTTAQRSCFQSISLFRFDVHQNSSAKVSG